MRGSGFGRTFVFWLILVAAAGGAARAQNVRPLTSGSGMTRRLGDVAAEKQDRTDWPRVGDGETGTQAHVTFDHNNADVVLITNREFGLPVLLAEARKITRALDRPQADFLTFVGTKTTLTCDIEFNDYLERAPRLRRTDWELDLAALAAVLNRSRLPRPIVLFVRADEADGAALLLPGGQRRPLAEKTFFGLNEIPPGARLHFFDEIGTAGYVAAFLMGGVLLFGMMTIVAAPWQMAKARQKQAVERARRGGEPATPPDPAEVQKRYDRQPPLWIISAGFPLALLALFLLSDVKSAMRDAFSLLPTRLLHGLGPSTMGVPALGMFALMGTSSLRKICRPFGRAWASCSR